MITRLPDGQFYRASPAEYLIQLEGIGGLSTRLDPMGGEIIWTARTMSLRTAPQDVAGALGVPVQTPVRIIRSAWAAGAEPPALAVPPPRADDRFTGVWALKYISGDLESWRPGC